MYKGNPTKNSFYNLQCTPSCGIEVQFFDHVGDTKIWAKWHVFACRQKPTIYHTYMVYGIYPTWHVFACRPARAGLHCSYLALNFYSAAWSTLC